VLELPVCATTSGFYMGYDNSLPELLLRDLKAIFDENLDFIGFTNVL
jgi:hypothetical protein